MHNLLGLPTLPHVLIQDLALGHGPQDGRDRLQGSVGFPLCHRRWLLGVPLLQLTVSPLDAQQCCL